MKGEVEITSFTTQRERSRYAGRNTNGHYHFTDMWVKRNRQWQVVAAHGSRVDKTFDD